MKKIFFLSLILLALTIIFLLVYNFIFKKPAQVHEVDTPSIVDQMPTPTPAATEKKLSLITDVNTLSATLFGEDIRYFDEESGVFSHMSIRGTGKNEIYNPRLPIGDVSWSPSGSSAVMSTDDGSQMAFYNGETKPLPRNAEYASWSQEESNVLYKAYDEITNERTLRVFDIEKNSDRRLADIPFRRVLFGQIPESFVVAFWQESDSFTASELRSVGTINTSDPRLIYDGLFGADYSFSPDGQKILVSYVETSGGSTMNLGVMNKSGGEFTGLNIPTFTSKTVWSEDGRTVYYAQPLDIPDGAVLPNDYQQSKFTTQDSFWKVDVTTGKKSRLIDLEELPEEIDATNLFLYSDESILFFINRANGNLYRMNI